MSVDVKRISEQVITESRALQRLRLEVENVIVGQRDLIDRLLVGILCNGHILIEGVPGLAKTLTVTTLANAMRTSFQRIQFTPTSSPPILSALLSTTRNRAISV